MDQRGSFFRQSSWLVLANATCGVLMAAVHVLVNRIDPAEYAVLSTLLRLLLLMGIPAAGLQTIFAQQAAAALTDRERQELGETTRAVLRAILICWLGLTALVLFTQRHWLAEFKVTNPAALWLTLLTGLLFVCAPVLRGLLQGQQQFAGLGWVMVFDGAGRFISVAVVVFLGGQAAGAMGGAFLGNAVSLALAAWLTRGLWHGRGTGLNWRAWLGKVLPLTLGVGSVLFMMNADVVFVQSVFGKTQTPAYMAAAMTGFALLTFTTPVVAVMFPKIVQSSARAEKSNAMWLALGACALLAASGAVVCTLFPSLPLRIIYVRNPAYWSSAPLVPWFAWAMLPLILANVLICNLLAHGRFRVIPWLLVVVAAYAAALFSQASGWLQLEPFDAFRRIVQTLGLFNLALLALALGFTWALEMRRHPTPRPPAG